MFSRFNIVLLKPAIVAWSVFVFSSIVEAQTIVNGDVTGNLSGSFFVDDAATGGGDVTTHDDTSPRNIGPRFWDLNSNGLIDDLGIPGTVTVEGFGFASSATASANDATSVDLTFVYLGSDQIVSGDDVTLGTRTVGYNHTGAGEYFINFDTPISGSIDGLGQKFLLQLTVNDLDGGLQESIRFKSNPLMFETFNGPKLSVSGSFDIDAIAWGIDGSGVWNTAGNWNPNTVPGVGGESGGNALLGDAITAPATVTLDTSPNLSNLLFQNENSYTVSDGGGSNTITLSGGAAISTLSGAHEIDAQIVGTAGLNKVGGGAITLSGTNTYSGTTSIQGGTLAISDNSNLGNASNGIEFQNGAALRVDGTTLAILPRSVTMTSNGTINVSDPNHTVDLTGAISGSGLFVKAGEGALSLDNASGITGDIHVNVGTLVVDNNNGLGNSTGITKVDAGGGTVELDGSGGSLTIAENFSRLQGRFDTVPESHIVNTAGNNTLSGTLDGSGDSFSNVRIDNDAAGTTLTINNTAGSPASLLDSDDEDLRFVFGGSGDITIGNSSTPGSGKIVGSSVDVVVAMDDPSATVTIGTAANSLDTSNATGSYWGGATVVESGTLAVESNLTGVQGELATTAINIRSGATFDVSDFSSYALQVVTDPDNSGIPNGDETGQLIAGAGTVVTDPNGRITFFEDSRLSPGDSAGTLNVTGNMRFNMTQANPNGALNYELSDNAAGVNDLLAVSDTLTLDQSTTGTFNLNVTPIDGDLDTSAYTIMTAGTSANGGTALNSDFVITILNPQGNAVNTRQDDSASVSIGSNAVTVTFSAAQSHNWTGSTDGTWDVGTTANWSSSDNLFFDLDTVTFGDGTGQTTINIGSDPNVAEPVSPGDVVFSNSVDTYTFTGDGIHGAGGIALGANSNVILANNANLFTGDVSIAGGASLTLGDGATGGLNTLAEENNVAISAGGALIHNDVDGETINGTVSGAGEVRNTSGTLVLTAANTYTGPTTINGGTIRITDVNGVGSDSTGTTVNSGGTLQVNTVAATVTEDITLNGGTLRVGGSGEGPVETLFSKDIVVGTGGNAALRLDGDTDTETTNGMTVSGNIIGSNGNGLNVRVGNNSTMVVTGNVNHDGTLSKTAAGTLELQGANSYSGATTISDGTLALTGTASIASTPQIDVQSGASFDVTGTTGGSFAIASGQSLTGAGTVSGNISAASNSTIRVGGTAGGVPFVTAGLQLHYDAAQDAAGDSDWSDLSDGGGGFVDLQFQGGNASPIAASDGTLQSLTAAYDISSSSAALAPGASNSYFQGFREQQSGTFEIVFNVSNLAAGSEQVLIDIGGARGLSLVLDGNTLKAGVNGNADTIGLTENLASGWHHAVVVVGDGPAIGADDDFSLYLNNVLVDSQTNVQIDDYAGDNNWGFGGTPGAVVVDPNDGTAATLGSPQDYHGDIALIRYYLAEFDSTDVAQNYASLSASQAFVDVDTLTMDGDLTLNTNSVLEIDIWDTTNGNDLLDVSGAFSAAGTLDVDLVGTVGLGDSFDILDFDPNTVSGSFDVLDLPTLGGGLGWDTSSLLSTGVLTVITAPVENADFDGSGLVNGLDFLIWQQNFGGPGTQATGDANGDGTVNDADLAIWESQYGTTPLTSNGTAVPEPSCIMLSLLCGCFVACRRRSR